MLHILIPKTHIEIDPKIPVFFLAGPVRGGDDWQKDCCTLLEKYIPDQDFYVAIPYYVDILPKNHNAVTKKVEGDQNYFPRQLDWERYYIELASKQGCLMFWLPVESKTNPRIGGGPYATDTRGELGEWRGRMMYDKSARVVIGGQEGFDGLDIIQRNFKHALGDTFQLYDTLEHLVVAAVKKI
jgi:hypothetical protein